LNELHIARQSPLFSRAIPAERGRELAAMTGNEHDRALRGVAAALNEQDRSRARYQAAIGTSTELGAYTRLRAAGEEVAARGAWLNRVDDGAAAPRDRPSASRANGERSRRARSWPARRAR
jgi:hypothetical protein